MKWLKGMILIANEKHPNPHLYTDYSNNAKYSWNKILKSFVQTDRNTKSKMEIVISYSTIHCQEYDEFIHLISLSNINYPKKIENCKCASQRPIIH